MDENSRAVRVNQGATRCGAQRIVPAGGDLTSLMLHPTFVPLERVYRRLPVEGIYWATNSRPFTFEMGAFRVPKATGFVVAEYRFEIFRFNGAAPNDAVPVEQRRLPLQVGYDINIDQYRKGNLEVEILPAPPQTQQSAFASTVTGGSITSAGAINLMDLYGQNPAPPAVATIYDSTLQGGPNSAALANTTIGGAPAGSALLPTGPESSQGPSRFPFCYYARENQSVQLTITVFSAIPIPIAFFEAWLAGYLMPLNVLDTMLDSVAPCTNPTGPG